MVTCDKSAACQTASKQSPLLRPGTPEFPGIEPVALARAQAKPPASDVEPASNQLRELPFPLHAGAELRVVFAAASRVADSRHDVGCLEGIAPLEPILEKVLHLPRKPQQRVAGHPRPRIAGAL